MDWHENGTDSDFAMNYRDTHGSCKPMSQRLVKMTSHLCVYAGKDARC